MPPFRYEGFVNPYASSIADLLAHGNDARARAAEQIGAAQARAVETSGAAWSGAVQNAAHAAAAIPGQIEQSRAQEQERQVRAQQLEQGAIQLTNARREQAGKSAVAGMMSGDGMQPGDMGPRQGSYLDENGLFDVKRITQRLGQLGYGDNAASLVKSAESVNDSILKHQDYEQKTATQRTILLGDLADGAKKLVEHGMPLADALDFVVQPALATKRFTPEDYAKVKDQILPLPPDQQTQALTTLMDQAARLGGDKTLGKDAKEVDRYGRTTATNIVEEPGKGDYTINDQRFKAGGQPIGQPVPKQVDPTEKALHEAQLREINAKLDGSLPMSQKDRAELETQRIHAIAQQAHWNAQDANVKTDDVSLAVKAMKDGDAPPLLPGRASKEYLATIAESKRQGFDLASAVTDWNATQKHIASMNGNQQLRLNQSINALPDMLDSVDALASQWKGGEFPLLNRANLALAKGGAYGPKVASVANKLEAQIADVTADLGNVYMGGNSPTDHALQLAGKNLNSNWDEKVLHDMVTLARQNVTIRRNSIKNTGVAGASDGNPYVPVQKPSFSAGDTVSIGGKRVKISAIHPDGTFDGAEVK